MKNAVQYTRYPGHEIATFNGPPQIESRTALAEEFSVFLDSARATTGNTVQPSSSSIFYCRDSPAGIEGDGFLTLHFALQPGRSFVPYAGIVLVQRELEFWVLGG